MSNNIFFDDRDVDDVKCGFTLDFVIFFPSQCQPESKFRPYFDASSESIAPTLQLLILVAPT